MSEAKERWWKRLPSIQGVITLVVVLAVSFVAFSVGRAVGPGEGEGGVQGEGLQGEGEGEGEGEDPASEEEVEYVCPMHPQIRQPEFGTCPICLMDLVPVAVESGGDFIALQPSDAAIQLANVRIEEVGRPPLTEHIEVFGRVATAGDGAAEITAWTGGRIERLYVEVEGEEVQRGQRLARIYSPELVVAQETLLHAERILREAESTGSETRRRTAQAAYDAARTELRLLGFDDDDIDDLVEDGEADEYVTLRAPASGTIMERHIAEGDYVQPGTRILSLADLDEVWIQLEIFERDLPFVNVGDTVHLRAGDAEGEATISFIDPMIDPVRRVARGTGGRAQRRFPSPGPLRGGAHRPRAPRRPRSAAGLRAGELCALDRSAQHRLRLRPGHEPADVHAGGGRNWSTGRGSCRDRKRCVPRGAGRHERRVPAGRVPADSGRQQHDESGRGASWLERRARSWALSTSPLTTRPGARCSG